MMRYRFIDKVVSLTLDDTPRIEVLKTFHADDDAFSGPSGGARVPESLLLELMAMTGGHLIFRQLGERRLPLLLKVPDCHFSRVARPGTELRAVAALGGSAEVADGTEMVEATTEIFTGTERVADATLMYLCVSVPGVDLVAQGAAL